jgi:hypothetical protein
VMRWLYTLGLIVGACLAVYGAGHLFGAFA